MKAKQRAVSWFLAIVVTFGFGANAWAAPTDHPHLPDQVILKFKAGTAKVEEDQVLGELRAQKVRGFGRINAALHRIEGMTVEEAIARYASHPKIEFIEPNYIVDINEIPNDPRFGELWGLSNQGQTGGTPGADIMATSAWDVFTGSPNVVVGVIDTGVDYLHPDLAANIYANPGEIPGNGIDDDGNGFVDDVRGWDFVNNDNDPMDDNGHGTHCAGTIGAVGNNGIGVAGVNWNVKIMPLKFLSAGGSGSTADAVECIEYATMMGVHLTSNSWGGGGFSEAMRQAIADAQTAGILFVAAAGNSSSNNDVSPHYPSNYDLDNVISVAATDHNDQLASFSSYGATTVDLAGPGVNVLSTLPGNSYGLLSGTSMATPHVAGVAAMIFGRFPAISAPDAKNLMLNFVDPLPSLDGRVLTGGRLNAFFPIADPDETPPGDIADLAAVQAGSNWVDLAWTATGDDGTDGTASRYELRYATFPLDNTNFLDGTRAGNEPDPQPAGSSESMRVYGLDFDTTYWFAVRALDEFGNPGLVVNSAAGTTLGIPDISAAPTSLSETLLTGATSSQQITLSNVGLGTLDFTVPVPVLLGTPQTVNAAVELGKGEPDLREGQPVLLGSGGPDAFGYRWFDSNDPFGPAFAWTDIAGSGLVALSSGDDVAGGPFEIGFDFPFYGGEFSQFWVNSNGTISLSSNASPYSNQPLPSGGAPAHLIAPFWDDLVIGSAGNVYYESDGSRLVVQFDSIDHYGSGGPYTFQVVLDSDGTITYQYETMNAPLNSATVGIQNGSKTDGLTVAFNTEYVENGLAVQLRAVPQWVTVTPSEGTVYAPNSTTLTADFDASGLLGGDYDGTIRILSNDPDESAYEIPVFLTVIGAPNLTIEPTSIDFGGHFVGATPTATFELRNTGTDVLTVSSVSVDDAVFSLDTSVASIPARSSVVVTVTFAPTDPIAYSGTVTVQSDDPDQPTQTVSLAGVGQTPPQFSIGPNALASSLFTGERETQQLTIQNNGGADFTFDAVVDFGTSVTVHEYVEVGKDELDLRVGDPVLLGSGGPDAYGYRWIDSNEPGGPLFDWVDISSTGTPVTSSTGDDRNWGPFPIGFDFPFYEDSFSTFRVCSNGWVSFTSTSASLGNQLLPNGGAPENLLAAFWDDLVVDLSLGGNVYYQNDGGRLIIQYDNVRRFSSGGPYTFQVMLYANGTIVYQYLSMQGTRLDEATIGLQNGARDDGLTVAYNTDYVEDGLAIKIAASPEWLVVSPNSGTVPPGGSLVVDARFNANELFGGTYEADIVLNTNDPLAPTFVVPATLDVTGAPNIEVALDGIDFGDAMIGYPDLVNEVVFNTGTDNLVLTAVSTDNPAFQVNVTPPVNIGPTGQFLFDVRFSPSAVGPANATLTILSNDPDSPSLAIPLSGNGILAPTASVSPTSLQSDLFTGESEVQTVMLSNSGGSDLTFEVVAEFTAIEDVVVAEYVEVGKDEEDTRPGLLGSGGPDNFGYRWIDSNDPAGPTFSWIEIAATGTPVTSSTGDDRNWGPFPIGFDFPFYEDSFSTFRVCSNGWVSFTSTSASLGNQLLPNGGAPENLLAAFWDDLVVDLSLGGNVYYQNDGGRLIIQYDNVRRFSSGGPYTFQVMLYANGTIVYQYLSMQGTRLNEATIGLQNGARDDGLTVAFNTGYVEDNLAIRIGATPDWLTASPASGVVPPGGSIPISVTFDASGLFGGQYDGNVRIVSNDPANGLIDVAALMNVTGVPQIATDPMALLFDLVYVGFSADLPLTVTNEGTDQLIVSNISSTNGDFSVSPTNLSLAPFESAVVTVTFAPTEVGTRAGDLVFESNDPDSPTTVAVSGPALMPPDIATTPTAIEAASLPGDVRTKILQICNEGSSPLDWQLAAAADVTATVIYPAIELEKEAEDPRPGILGSGGPDAFGYTWVDSNDPAGPVFDWVDISGVGTPMFGSYSDDGNRGPAPIGFDFPFYGQTFDELRVASNGFISFTATNAPFTNQPLPSTGAPGNLLAVFWDDMVVDPSDGNEVYVYNDGSRCIVQFEVRRIAQSNPPYYSFQAILYPNGSIVYQYNGLGSTQNSATIGIQNAAGDDGLMVAFNQAYVAEGMAIQFSAAPEWLSASPEAGTLQPGECVEVVVTLDASDLDAGDYTGSIDIVSNDPDEPLLSVPVTFHVGSIDVMADIDPNTLNLTSNGRWITARFALPMEYDPADIVLETVSFMGEVPADRMTLDTSVDPVVAEFKFPRAAAEEVLPEGQDVDVFVQGEIRDTIWFIATDTIRVIRPRLTAFNEGGDFAAGATTVVTWENPDAGDFASNELWFTQDDGETWTVLATDLTGTQYTWKIPVLDTETARLRVVSYNASEVIGFDTSNVPFTIASSATGVDSPVLPRSYELSQNAPNPFNPKTTIEFALPKPGLTQLTVYDARGRQIRTLLAEPRDAGYHAVTWDGIDDNGQRVSSGVYFYRLSSGDFVQQKRMVLVK